MFIILEVSQICGALSFYYLIIDADRALTLIREHHYPRHRRCRRRHHRINDEY